jgi:hypothetical protein
VQFFLSSLKRLPQQFGLNTTDFKKGNFPYKFDKPENWSYKGPFPALEFYAPHEMTPKDALDLEEWHRQQQGKTFDFRKESLDYCLTDVRLLLAAMQVSIKEDLAFMEFDGMGETCTIASKTMLFFRHQFLEKNEIGVIPQGGYRGHRNQSREGQVWLLLQERDVYPGLQHARSTLGEKIICGFPVDGYHAPSKTILQFHGCYFHGCETCYTRRSLVNSLNGETFDALRLKTAKRTLKLEKAGFKVVEKWACEVSEAERQRMESLGLNDRVSQLIPKDAFYGGRTEAVNLAVTTEPHSNMGIRYYDVTSEYPFVNARKEYPVGHPTVLLKHQLPQTASIQAQRCSLIPTLSHLLHGKT